MAITIRLSDGRVSEISEDSVNGQGSRNERVEAVVQDYARYDSREAYEVINNRLERARLLNDLHRLGLETWEREGGRTRFDVLVEQATSRPFDGYITDYEEWERLYGDKSNSRRRSISTEMQDGRSLNVDDLYVAVIDSEILRIGEQLAVEAISNTWVLHREYTIGEPVKLCRSAEAARSLLSNDDDEYRLHED